MKTKIIYFGLLSIIATATGYFFLSPLLVIKQTSNHTSPAVINTAQASKFDYLSKNGNSSCSTAFKESIAIMVPGERIQGSCCSPMDRHRYEEQVEALKKYKDYAEVPPDPYDIDATLAARMLAHYDDQLTTGQQQAYDYAMQNSNEKGPCCCKCWHWYVYGGLAKVLIQKYSFTGDQIAEVWDLSDGCGGAGHHANHS